MEHTDVLVVGAGPTGLTIAHLCDRLGLACTVLERRDGPQRSPAAHAVNARTFEIWRQAGVAMEPILGAATDPAESGWVHWVTKLGADVIGSLPYERQGEEMLAITPTPLRNLSQHRLEPLLLPPGGDVRYRHAWVGAEQDADGVTAEVDGPEGRYQVRARYLLGADGAASAVRHWLGIELIGPRTIESFLMVHLRAPLAALVGETRGVLFFVADPASGGVFVNHGRGEWVYMRHWEPATEPVEDFTPARVTALAQAAMARPVDLEVLGVSTWHMSAQIAEHYRAGRAFLVGDAAHRFPPTGGLGLNTGVADAHNLTWKLAAAETGWADAGILDTYEQERRPVAQFNADQSLTNAFKLIEVAIALGHSADVEAATIQLHARLADPVARANVEQAIADQATHFDLLGLQLGQRYDDGVVVPDGSPAAAVADPARDYQPSTRPGGRLPHRWLPDGRSTLDLVDPVVLTLLGCEGHLPAMATGRTPVVRVPVDAGTWTDLGLRRDDCLLVRPDQHIAARGSDLAVAEAVDRLFAGERV